MMQNIQHTTYNIQQYKEKKVVSCKLLVSRSRSGFTLIELLVTVSIITILATTSFVFLGSYRSRQNLEKTLDSIEAVVTATQKRSITQDAGKQWGVRFTSSSTVSQYEIFSGASYSTSTSERTYGVKAGIQFFEPSVGNSFDALFAPITGTLPTKKIISLATGRGDGFVGDLLLSTSGKITKRNEKGLVGYWHLDEGSGTTARDVSGTGNTGTITSGTTWQVSGSCPSGGCLVFNGSQLVNAGNNASVKISQGTMMAWIKTANAGASYRGIVAKQSAYGMFLMSNVFGLYNWGGTGWMSTGILLNDNAWHHVACSFQSGVANGTLCYIDGVLKLTTSMSVVNQNVTLQIAEANAGQYFTGSIDEVRVYNRVLTASEILNIYNDLK